MRLSGRWCIFDRLGHRCAVEGRTVGYNDFIPEISATSTSHLHPWCHYWSLFMSRRNHFEKIFFDSLRFPFPLECSTKHQKKSNLSPQGGVPVFNPHGDILSTGEFERLFLMILWIYLPTKVRAHIIWLLAGIACHNSKPASAAVASKCTLTECLFLAIAGP